MCRPLCYSALYSLSPDLHSNPGRKVLGHYFHFRQKNQVGGAATSKCRSTMKLQSGFMRSGWGSLGDSRVQRGVAATAARVGRECPGPATNLGMYHMLCLSLFQFSGAEQGELDFQLSSFWLRKPMILTN